MHAKNRKDRRREAGFTLACSTAWGAVRQSDDPLQLPRVSFVESQAPRLLIRLHKSYWERQSARA